MTAKMTLERIKEHWEQAGSQFPTGGRILPTSRDPYLGQLEEENILSHLGEGNHVLEIGCGDGIHTVHYAKRVKELSGIDIAQSLIDIARRRAKSESVQNVNFTVGSVLDIGTLYGMKQFNCIISQRCLINLPEWKHQQEAILQALGLLKKGGLFLLSEGFQEELDNLNVLRQRFDLPQIRVVDYNRNLIRKDFEEFVSRHFHIVEVRNYGFYLFFSRLFHPVAVSPEEPRHDSKLNEAAMMISRIVQFSELDRYSYNLFYVLRKQ